DFVRESLIEIACGVREANAEINRLRSGEPGIPTTTFILDSWRGDTGGTKVDFDIAVSLTHESKGEGSGRLMVSVVEASLGKEKISGSEQVSRLRFSVVVESVVGR